MRFKMQLQLTRRQSRTLAPLGILGSVLSAEAWTGRQRQLHSPLHLLVSSKQLCKKLPRHPRSSSQAAGGAKLASTRPYRYFSPPKLCGHSLTEKWARLHTSARCGASWKLEAALCSMGRLQEQLRCQHSTCTHHQYCSCLPAWRQ